MRASATGNARPWFTLFALLIVHITGAIDPSHKNYACPADAGLPQALPLDHPWVVRHGYSGTVLSLNPLVVEVDEFMSAEECEAVIASVKTERDFAGCGPQCSSYWPRQLSARARRPGPSPVFDMLEERLGNLTGLQDHADEASIKVNSYAKPIEPLTVPPDAYALHHEKIGRPRRVATVLVYLRTLEPREGGHTVFPAAQLTPAEGGVAAARRVFGAITPPNGTCFQITEHEFSSPAGDQVGVRSPEAAADPNVGKARSLAEAACRDASAGSPSAVATQAVRGKAVVWYHELGRNQKVDPMAWHAGCFVRSLEAQRWVLQKFKEHPERSSGLATPRAFYDVMKAHKRAAHSVKSFSYRETGLET